MGATVMSKLTAFDNNQIHDDYTKLERLYSRWLVGDGGVINDNELPSDFAQVLHATPANKKSLFSLALASQYQALMLGYERVLATEDNTTLSTQIDAIKPLPILPPLDYPFVPTHLKYLMQLITRQFKKGRGRMYELLKEKRFLQFLAYRGYVLLPNEALDIIQQFRDDEYIHPAYLPWIQWLGKDGSATKVDDKKTEHTVKTSKKSKLSNTPENLQDSHLSLAQELKDYFQLRTNRENNSQSLMPKKLASDKLIALRVERLKQVDLTQFADVFGLTLAELIEVWDIDNFVNIAGSTDLNKILLENMAVNLPDAHLPAIINKVCDYIVSQSNGARLYYLHDFLPRLDEEATQKVLVRLFCEANIEYANLASLLKGKPLLLKEHKQIQDSLRWQAIIQSVKPSQENSEIFGVTKDDIEYLGMLLPQDLAKWAHQTLIDNGLSEFEPALYVLNLNQRLPKSE